jgi:ABC-type Fe3+-hydroxamate transport system substrate-binding protein
MHSLRFQNITWALLLLFTIGVLTGCGNSNTTTTTTPASAASQPAVPRIVSTVPAATLNLVLIGASDRLVGISTYDKPYLSEKQKDLPVVGDYEEINYEQLIKLKPSVLIIQKAPSRIAPRLLEVAAQQNITILNMHFDHVDDIWSSVRELGKAAGAAAAAEDAIQKAQADLADLAAKYKNARHPKVAYMANSKMIVGGATFMEEMIVAAGGDNLGRIVGNGFLDINNDTLVRLAPEVVLLGAPDEPAAMENDPRIAPFFRLQIPAAQSKRIFLVTDGTSLQPSVDIGKNVRALAELIHKDPAAAPRPGGNP